MPGPHVAIRAYSGIKGLSYLFYKSICTFCPVTWESTQCHLCMYQIILSHSHFRGPQLCLDFQTPWPSRLCSIWPLPVSHVSPPLSTCPSIPLATNLLPTVLCTCCSLHLECSSLFCHMAISLYHFSLS